MPTERFGGKVIGKAKIAISEAQKPFVNSKFELNEMRHSIERTKKVLKKVNIVID